MRVPDSWVGSNIRYYDCRNMDDGSAQAGRRQLSRRHYSITINRRMDGKVVRNLDADRI